MPTQARGAGGSIKPGVKRSETPGLQTGRNRARGARDSPVIHSTKRLSPASQALPFLLRRSWSVRWRPACGGVCRGKGFLCANSVILCVCGGIAKENAHHRGTEIAQRTTEANSPTDSGAGDSIKPRVERNPRLQPIIVISPRRRAAELSLSDRRYREVHNALPLSPASRARNIFLDSFLGLTPQALCCRLLRRLKDWAARLLRSGPRCGDELIVSDRLAGIRQITSRRCPSSD